MPSPVSRISYKESSEKINHQEGISLPNTFQYEEDTKPDTTDVSNERKSLNSTAYRIFKLLEWLIKCPLTLKDLNDLFVAEPLIGKAVSDDTVWFYVNTLKLLGCRIRRPSPKNRFCYELLSHPFTLSLPEAQQEMLIIAKAYAQKSFNHREMMILDGLLKKLTQHFTVPLALEVSDVTLNRNETHDLDRHVQLLEQHIPQNKLFLIHYCSPLSGSTEFYFLPEILYYEHGVLFVRGESSNGLTSTSLRLDWISSLYLVERPPLREELYQRRNRHVKVQLRVYISDFTTWNGLNLDVRHGIYAETFEKKHLSGQSHVDIKLQVRDFLHLKQKLLSSTTGFQVLLGEGFRQDLYDTLRRMDKLYQPSVTQPVKVLTD